ncbi:MAG: hypothetical protein ACK5KM_10060 [Hyphomicrobiaceae bacterium]
MKHKISILALFGVLLCVASPIPPAFADETGLATALHEARPERGGRLCLTDHFHSGSSAGKASKKIAMREAIDSWRGFTAMEYGSDWASYNLAGSKSMKCAQTTSGWACDVEARACKRMRRKRR